MKKREQADFRAELVVAGKTYSFYSLEKLARSYQTTVKQLPYSIRVLLESVLRQADGEDVTTEHWERLLAFGDQEKGQGDVPFKPARVVLQDFTGVPAIVDLAAMREAVIALGGKAEDINPAIPVDLVVDHSVQVDHAGTPQALAQNVALEFERNKERYQFLKWAQQAFDHYRVVPPATGIIHQVNIEYLSDVVLTQEQTESPFPLLFPDSLVGTDSHTTMINGLGVLGWGVGGIEAEAGMLGEPSYFPLPEVIGVRLVGKLAVGATATDLALRVTERLRQEQVVGKFVEFFGAGYTTLSLADRATIANMAPEYGATCGFFPVDAETIRYLNLTGRSPKQIEITEAYLKANQLFYDEAQEATYTKVIELDLASIETNLSGPKRPQDVIPLSQMKERFQHSLTAPAGNQGFGLAPEEAQKVVAFDFNQQAATLKTGDITIAAITSCTNTSNPAVMLAAGLLARNAVAKGLEVSPLVKTSLAPGSQVVTAYLEDAGLLAPLEKLGFAVVGYGCTTCIGNSGPLDAEISAAIQEEDLLVGAVLSGNRNFEGRIHPLVKANFLASPPLVVAYALAGNVGIDLKTEPLGYNAAGEAVYLTDVWPERSEIDQYIEKYVTPELYQEYYAQVFDANAEWNQIAAPESHTYEWQASSTYIAKPPFFEGMQAEPSAEQQPLTGLRVLAKFGDSVTTDHISPAGTIGMRSPAGQYLQAHGVKPRNFNSFGSRRGHHEVMMRGTFGNIRIRNDIAQGTEGGYTTYWPSGEVLSIYDAAMRYQETGTGLVVLTGEDYGMGSSRDWAAKGTRLLGVKAVIAKSYERIHRSNLVMMGVLPLQYQAGEDASTLGLTGEETFTIDLPEKPTIRQTVAVVASAPDGTQTRFTTIARFDAQADLRYYAHQGILPMVIRKKVAQRAE